MPTRNSQGGPVAFCRGDSMSGTGASRKLWLSLARRMALHYRLGPAQHLGSDKERPVAYACAVRQVISKLRVLPGPPAT